MTAPIWAAFRFNLQWLFLFLVSLFSPPTLVPRSARTPWKRAGKKEKKRDLEEGSTNAGFSPTTDLARPIASRWLNAKDHPRRGNLFRYALSVLLYIAIYDSWQLFVLCRFQREKERSEPILFLADARKRDWEMISVSGLLWNLGFFNEIYGFLGKEFVICNYLCWIVQFKLIIKLWKICKKFASL